MHARKNNWSKLDNVMYDTYNVIHTDSMNAPCNHICMAHLKLPLSLCPGAVNHISVSSSDPPQRPEDPPALIIHRSQIHSDQHQPPMACNAYITLSYGMYAQTYKKLHWKLNQNTFFSTKCIFQYFTIVLLKQHLINYTWYICVLTTYYISI